MNFPLKIKKTTTSLDNGRTCWCLGKWNVHLTETSTSKHAFQWDAYRLLQWPWGGGRVGVCPGGLSAHWGVSSPGGGVCPGGGCLLSGRGSATHTLPNACWDTHSPPCPVHAGIQPPAQGMLGYPHPCPVHAGIRPPPHPVDRILDTSFFKTLPFGNFACRP